jgi:CHASE2 domain-containing sensor protein
MIKYLCLFIGVVVSWGFKEEKSDRIVIVDIEHLDRTGIAKEIKVIRQCNPKVIGLNFLLTTDSLSKDVALTQEITHAKNIVQGVKLHNNSATDISVWDSLEHYHPKFGKASFGFVNLSITDDSVLIPEMPMKQYHNGDAIPAFCYTVADLYNANEIKPIFRNSDQDLPFPLPFFFRRFKIISAQNLLSGNFNKRDLAGKIVLMGYMGNDEDHFYLDKARTKPIHGTEIQACLIAAICVKFKLN